MIWHAYRAVSVGAPPMTWYASDAGKITATPQGVTLDLHTTPLRPDQIADVVRVMGLATAEHERMVMR